MSGFKWDKRDLEKSSFKANQVLHQLIFDVVGEVTLGRHLYLLINKAKKKSNQVSYMVRTHLIFPFFLSVQIVMTLDSWSLSSLPEISLLFLRFIRLFVTSQLASAPLRTAPWTFYTFGSLLRSWAFIRSWQISILHFFTSKSELFCGFWYVFLLVLNFSKALGFCQTLFAISARSLLIYPLFLHLCQVLELSLSDQSQNLHPLIPCWFLKYHLGYLPVHCHHRHEDWPCHHIHVLIRHLTLSGIISSCQP